MGEWDGRPSTGCWGVRETRWGGTGGLTGVCDERWLAPELQRILLDEQIMLHEEHRRSSAGPECFIQCDTIQEQHMIRWCP